MKMSHVCISYLLLNGKFCGWIAWTIAIFISFLSLIVAQMVENLPAMQETQVQFLSQEDSPGEGNGNPLQYSCLENSNNRGSWQGTVHGVKKSQTQLHYYTTTTTVTNKILHMWNTSSMEKGSQELWGSEMFFSMLITRLTSFSWMLREENKLGLENKYSRLFTVSIVSVS